MPVGRRTRNVRAAGTGRRAPVGRQHERYEDHAELRRLARAHLRHERPSHTLQATELAHEAYLRLAGVGQHDWRDRAHFFAVASGIGL